MGATSENNAASNHSSDYVACDKKNKEYSEKGSDAQVSALTPSSSSVSDNTVVFIFKFFFNLLKQSMNSMFLF